VLLASGYASSGYSSETYDPATGAWTAASTLSSGRQAHTATLLPDKNNDLTNFYIDADSYLLVKQNDKIKFDTKEISAESILSNYKQVNGVMFPYSIESKSPDNPMGSAKIVVDSIETNLTVDDSIFKMPATK
jgi:hypothetical protein